MADTEDKKVYTVEDLQFEMDVVNENVKNNKETDFEKNVSDGLKIIQAFVDGRADLDAEALEKMSEFIDFYLGKGNGSEDVKKLRDAAIAKVTSLKAEIAKKTAEAEVEAEAGATPESDEIAVEVENKVAEKLAKVLQDKDVAQAKEVIASFMENKYDMDLESLGMMREVVNEFKLDDEVASQADAVVGKITGLELEHYHQMPEFKVEYLSFEQYRDLRASYGAYEEGTEITEENKAELEKLDKKFLGVVEQYNEGQLFIRNKDLDIFKELLKEAADRSTDEEVKKTVEKAQAKSDAYIADFERHYGIYKDDLASPEVVEANYKALDLMAYDKVLLGRQDIPQYEIPAKDFTEAQIEEKMANLEALTLRDMVELVRSGKITSEQHEKLLNKANEVLSAIDKKYPDCNIPEKELIDTEKLKQEGKTNQEIATEIAIVKEALGAMSDVYAHKRLSGVLDSITADFEKKCPPAYDNLHAVDRLLEKIDFESKKEKELKAKGKPLTEEQKIEIKTEKAQKLQLFKDTVRQETIMYLANTTKDGKIDEKMFVEEYVNLLQLAALRLTGSEQANKALEQKQKGEKLEIDFDAVFNGCPSKVSELAFAAHQNAALETMNDANNKLANQEGYKGVAKTQRANILSLASRNQTAVSESIGQSMRKTALKTAGMGLAVFAASTICPPVSGVVVSGYFLIKSGIGLYKTYKQQKREATKNDEKYNLGTFIKKNPLRCASFVVQGVAAGMGATGAVEWASSTIESGGNIGAEIINQTANSVKEVCSNIVNNITGNGASFNEMLKSAFSSGFTKGAALQNLLQASRYGIMLGGIVDAVAKAPKGKKLKALGVALTSSIVTLATAKGLSAVGADATTLSATAVDDISDTDQSRSEFYNELKSMESDRLVKFYLEVTGKDPEIVEGMNEELIREVLIGHETEYKAFVEAERFDADVARLPKEIPDKWEDCQTPEEKALFCSKTWPDKLNNLFGESHSTSGWDEKYESMSDEQKVEWLRHAQKSWSPEGKPLDANGEFDHEYKEKIDRDWEEQQKAAAEAEKKARIAAMREEMKNNPLKPVLSPKMEEALKGKIEQHQGGLKMPDGRTLVVNPEDSLNRQLDATDNDAVNGDNSLKEVLERARNMDGQSDEQVVRDTGDDSRDFMHETTDKLSKVHMSAANNLKNNQVIVEIDELGNKHYIGKDAEGNTFKLSVLSSGGILENGYEISIQGTNFVLDVSKGHELYDALNNNSDDIDVQQANFWAKTEGSEKFAKDLMSKINNRDYKIVSEVGNSTNTTEQAPKEEVVKPNEQAPNEGGVKSGGQVVEDGTTAPTPDGQTSTLELPSIEGYKGEGLEIFNSDLKSPTQDSNGYWVVQNENGDIIGKGLSGKLAVLNAAMNCTNAATSEFQYQQLAIKDYDTLTDAQREWMNEHNKTMKDKWGLERDEDGKLVKSGEERTVFEERRVFSYTAVIKPTMDMINMKNAIINNLQFMQCSDGIYEYEGVDGKTILGTQSSDLEFARNLLDFKIDQFLAKEIIYQDIVDNDGLHTPENQDFLNEHNKAMREFGLSRDEKGTLIDNYDRGAARQSNTAQGPSIQSKPLSGRGGR